MRFVHFFITVLQASLPVTTYCCT